MKCERERCDHCKKWVSGEVGLFNMYDPEHLNYDLIKSENEFSICGKCSSEFFYEGDREDVKKRIEKMRMRKAAR